MGERMSWKKEIRRNRVWRKWLAVWMMLALLVQSVPGAAFGAVMSGDGTPYGAATAGADGSGDGTGTGICPHHTRHTEECGYQEAHPCSHVHTAECYEVYDEDGDDGSGYEDSAATAATGSNAAVAGGGTTIATPSNATPSRVLNCPHSHDEDCGYAKAQPCEYECKICAGAELSLEEQAKRMEEQMAMQQSSRSALSQTNLASPANATFPKARMTSTPFTTRAVTSFRFTIGSEAVLRELQEKVADGATWAGGAISYAESAYVLTGDIRLNGDWTPVGTKEKPFTGTFDGGGYVISGMTFDAPDLEHCGLFGYVKGGTVENLGLKDVDVQGGENTGAVAGILYEGAVSRCYSTGNVEATGTYPAAGGIVGEALEDSAIDDCYSLADVNGNIAGGIAGNVKNSAVRRCYSTGKITFYSVSGSSGIGGGLVGVLHVDENRSTALTDSAALNPSVDGDRRLTVGRVWGIGTDPGYGEYSATYRGNYGFSGMKMNGGTASTENEENGADFWYDATNGSFSTPWETVLGDSDAWDLEDGKLPTLKNLGGQDGEIPSWLLEGIAADLYIGTAEELAAFRDRVNGNGGKAAEDFAGKTVRLTADIELDSSVDWVPIGMGDNTIGDNYFSGTFDGDGHVIRGLRIRSDADVGYAGLFGNVSSGKIRNLGVRDADIGVGATFVGAIAGYLRYGEITGCYSTGTVETNGINAQCGGIAGFTYGDSLKECKIEDCYSTATVESRKDAGGIVGEANGTVANCYYAGNAVTSGDSAGGIGGSSQYGSIKNCAALNAAVDQSGEAFRIITLSIYIPLEDNYAFSGMKLNGSAVLEGDPDVGANDAHGANLTYDSATGEFDVPWVNIFGGNTDAWDIEPYKLPTLKGVGGQDGKIPPWISGETDEILEIGSEAELAAFRDRVNGANGKKAENFAGKTVRLTADITLSGGADWTPIGDQVSHVFSGTFDGDGHVIRNVRIDDINGKQMGLFGMVFDGTVRNLGVEEVQIKGGDYIGGIAGYFSGSSLINCYSIGNVAGREKVGGLVGAAAGKATKETVIKNCWHAGNVAATVVGAGGVAGAIVGECEVAHCYSTGNTVTEEYSGGLIGYVSDSDPGSPVTGVVRYNAALTRTVDGKSSSTGRIYGELLDDFLAGSGWKENYAWSGMTAGGAAVSGDDGTGKNGKDGTASEIVLNEALFPDSDWILQEGCYPMLRQFAGRTPIPLDTWLSDQADGAFAMTLSPGAFRFPDAEAGYGAQPAAEFTIANTGKQKIDALTVELTNLWMEAGTGGGGISGAGGASGTAAPYFVLTGTDALADIPAGAGAVFYVAPAAGLPAGVYRAKVSVTGEYALRAEAAVEFTVTPKLYSVTVEHDGSGTADADYDKAAEGTTVELNAVPDSGYHFKEWQGAENLTFTQGGRTSQTAVFAMPGADVTVKAVFEKDAPSIVHVTGVALNKTELALTVGTAKKLTATVTPENASDRRVTWTSGDPDIASVEADGTVTALKAGTAVVTVQTADGGYTANCNVTVTLPPDPGHGNHSSDSSSDDDIRVDDRVLQGTWEQQEDGGWKFHKTDGEYARDQWGKIDGLWYHFDGDADMQTGWQNVDGQWYYLATEEDAKNRSGTGTGIEIGTGTGGEDGPGIGTGAGTAEQAGTGTSTEVGPGVGTAVGGKTGSVSSGGVKTGSMMTGWYYDSFYQRWFYLDATGAMAIGWQQIDGKWYYFNPLSDGMRGAMLADAWIDGWYVGKDGAWVQ